MSFYLGLDLGTSYFKAGIFDENGKLFGLGRQFVIKDSTNSTFCELSVTVFWDTIGLCISEAIQDARITSKDINAISYSSQANSFILLDDADMPLTPLVLWPDRRVDKVPVSVLSLIDRTDFLCSTGMGIQPGQHSLIAKVDWYQKNQPQLWKKVKRVMSISDYLVFMLTGQKVSDFSTASMTGLLNICELKWWKEAADLLSIKETSLSIPLKTGTLVGSMTDTGAQLTGLSKTTLLFAGGLDHHMVAIGAGLTRFNYISESTGTVLACVNYQEGYHPKNGINIAPGLDERNYFQLVFNNNGAVALEWYKQTYAPEYSIVELLKLAEVIELGNEGLIAKPCANTYENLLGFENINVSHSHGHFVRAILESTCSTLSKLTKVLDKYGKFNAIVPSGGGAQSYLWIKIKADFLNKTFLIPQSSELACQGAAMVCAIGVSKFKDIDEITKKWVKYHTQIHPNAVNIETYKNLYHNINSKN